MKKGTGTPYRCVRSQKAAGEITVGLHFAHALGTSRTSRYGMSGKKIRPSTSASREDYGKMDV